MELNYRLEPEEIEESLLCLNWRREGRIKQLHIMILSGIAIYCIAKYIDNSQMFFLMVLAFLCVCIMFILLYVSPLRRKIKAKKMSTAGTYRLRVPEQGMEQAFESENVFTIKGERQTYCIPKRVLKNEEKEQLIHVIQSNQCKFLQVKIGRVER